MHLFSRRRRDLFEAATASDRGCVREENEDRVALLSAPTGLLAVVADGMGGHASGERASLLAVTALARRRVLRARDPGTALAAAFADANRAILQDAARHPGRAGMGTTCTALLVRGSKAWCAHIGDSRLYLVRERAIYRMTEDDSLVMTMARRGLISLEEASRHEDRNVLERALGTHERADVTLWSEPLAVRAGDHFVLCTDGLHDLVADEELRDAVLGRRAAAACEGLVALARARGGYDNVSVAVAGVAS